MISVAVVIPVYKNELSSHETASLKNAMITLREYPIYLVSPGKLRNDKARAHLDTKYFKDKYFEGIEGYNKLLLNTEFYQSFSDYEYILIHQLDAWVFEDQLRHWCDQGYSYIGAPWIEKPPIDTKPIFDLTRFMINRVGNGGFSLRHIDRHISILDRYRSLTRFFKKNEDLFWSLVAPKLDKNFLVPSIEEAIGFAFELNPAKAFVMNHHQLPFGCHAWQKYDRTFWSRYIKLDE